MMNVEKSTGVVRDMFEVVKGDFKKAERKFDFDGDVPANIVSIVSGGSNLVELPYLQVYLDKMFNVALARSNGSIHIDKTLLADDSLNSMVTVINDLLDELIKSVSEELGETSDLKVLAFLKIFVTDSDTKAPVSLESILEKSRERDLTATQVGVCIKRVHQVAYPSIA